MAGGGQSTGGFRVMHNPGGASSMKNLLQPSETDESLTTPASTSGPPERVDVMANTPNLPRGAAGDLRRGANHLHTSASSTTPMMSRLRRSPHSAAAAGMATPSHATRDGVSGGTFNILTHQPIFVTSDMENREPTPGRMGPSSNDASNQQSSHLEEIIQADADPVNGTEYDDENRPSQNDDIENRYDASWTREEYPNKKDIIRNYSPFPSATLSIVETNSAGTQTTPHRLVPPLADAKGARSAGRAGAETRKLKVVSATSIEHSVAASAAGTVSSSKKVTCKTSASGGASAGTMIPAGASSSNTSASLRRPGSRNGGGAQRRQPPGGTSTIFLA